MKLVEIIFVTRSKEKGRGKVERGEGKKKGGKGREGGHIAFKVKERGREGEERNGLTCLD